MFVLIEKATINVIQKWSNVPSRIRIPGTGDVVMGASVPMDIGPDHVLREAVLVDPIFDPITQFRTGPAFDVADDFSVTETYTVRDKTAQEIASDELDQWKADMAASDTTMIPRWLEDHIRDDHGGISASLDLQAKYDAKKALRDTKPE